MQSESSNNKRAPNTNNVLLCLIIADAAHEEAASEPHVCPRLQKKVTCRAFV